MSYPISTQNPDKDLLDVGEEIRDYAIEQFQIIHQEFGYIHISDGAQGDQFLGTEIL